VVVAVAVVRMVKMAVDEVVDMIAMRNRFVSAVGTMDVGAVVSTALMVRGADRRIRGRESDYVLVNMAVVEMMKMTIVKVIDVVLVLDGSMTATGFVLVFVTKMSITFGHSGLLLGYS